MANQISIHFSCRSSRWLLGLMIVQWMTLSFTGWEVIWLVCELWYEIERKFSVVLNEEHALPPLAKLYFLSLKHCWLPTIVLHVSFPEDPFLKTAHREFKALGGNFHFQNLMGRTSMLFFSREEDTNTQEWRKSTTQKSQKRRRSFMQRRRRYEWTAQTSISSGTINSLTFHIKKRIFHSFSQKKQRGPKHPATKYS